MSTNVEIVLENRGGMEELREKEFYREKIIELIKGISRGDVLEYLYYFISGKIGGIEDEKEEI